MVELVQNGLSCELDSDRIPIYGMTTAACAAAVQDRVSLKRAVEAFNTILTNRDLICIGASRTITSNLFPGRLEYNQNNSTSS